MNAAFSLLGWGLGEDRSPASPVAAQVRTALEGALRPFMGAEAAL